MRNKIRKISFAAAVLMILFGLIVSEHARAEKYKTLLLEDYGFHLTETADSLRTINKALTKAEYTSDNQRKVILLTDVYAQAQIGREAFSRLPLKTENWESIGSVFTRIEDASLEGISTDGEESGISVLQGAGYVSLSEDIAALSAHIDETVTGVKEGKIELQNFNDSLFNNRNDRPTIGDRFTELKLGSISGETAGDVNQSSLQNSTAQMLEGKMFINQNEACDLASKFVGTDPKSMSVLFKTSDILPSYFCISREGKNTVTVQVSRRGGHVVSMVSSQKASKAILDTEDALKLASEYLSSKGYEDMSPVSWTKSGAMANIDFVRNVNGVKVYPESVKVSVSLDKGEVVNFDASEYIEHYSTRKLYPVKLNREGAQSLVASNLTIQKVQGAIIECGEEGEVLCYEIMCISNLGERFIIYIGTADKSERRIEILEEKNGERILV